MKRDEELKTWRETKGMINRVAIELERWRNHVDLQEGFLYNYI